jgi:hypothetical protein
MSGAMAAPLDEQEQLAFAVLEPQYAAVRDHYAAFVVEPGVTLERVRKTRLLVDESVRDSDRHYAACRDDGLLVVLAPQAARLPFDELLAILCHELGHAVDFLYPGRWSTERGRAAVWIPDGAKRMGRHRRLWHERSDDQVEWAADSIAEAVTGRRIRYCGCRMIQCFQGGVDRPPGLR